MTTIGDIEISKEEFENFNWEHVPSLSTEKRCSIYWPYYFEIAKTADTDGNQQAAKINRLLGAVTSLMLRPDDKQPFGILAEFHTGRSAALDDFSERQIEVFSEVLPDIADSELRSRVADIVWTRKRNHLAAETAIEAYISSAERLEDPNHWTHSEKRIRRALRLAASLGRDSRLFNSVIERIEVLLEKYKDEDPLYLTPKLLDLLIEYRKGDPFKYASYCKHAAEFSENLNNWERARRFWELQASWYSLLKQTAEHRQAKLNAIEAHITEAEHSLEATPPNYTNATYNLKSAAEALKRLGGQKERLEEVYKKLLETQKLNRQDFGEFSQTIDLAKEAKAAIESVKGKSFQEAVTALAMNLKSPGVGELRSFVDDLAKDSPLMALIPIIKVDGSGRVVGQRSSMLSTNPDEAEKAVRDEMFQQAITWQNMYAAGLIEPAQRQIDSDHYFDIRDFTFLVQNNPFIPPNHEVIFALGFKEGLRGNHVLASHLLMPQLENSLRHVLSQSGAITSMLTDEQIQHDYMLGKLLYMKELKQILGEDIVFDLQGLLVEKFGSNLRNRLLHGMLGFEEMHSYGLIYFWWLMLRLSILFLFARNSQTEGQENSR